VEILEVAEQLFRQVGFHKTTMSDVARAMNMSSSNVYRFFATKSELNETVARKILCQVETAAKAAVQRHGAADQNLRKVMTIIENMNNQLLSSDRNIHSLIATAYNESSSIVDDHLAEIDKLLELIIQRGMARGEFKGGDPRLAAIVIRSAYVRYYDFRLLPECRRESEPTVDQTMDFFLRALYAPSAPISRAGGFTNGKSHGSDDITAQSAPQPRD
jgi:AcrR family transcriptional regulator